MSFMRAAIAFFLIALSSSVRGETCAGMVPAGADHFFWRELMRGAQAAADERQVSLYVRPPNTEQNAKGQLLIIESIMREPCKGLLLAPSSKAVVDTVNSLAARNVPVVYADRDMGGDRISVVATDNYAAGYLAGQEMIELLGNDGRVALLRMEKGVVSTDARENGFQDAISASAVELAIDESIGSTVASARENTFRLFEDGAAVDGVFTPNESTTLGAMITLRRLGLSDGVRHIGFDATALLRDALVAGDLAGLVVQQPYRMGYIGMMTLIAAMDGEEVEPSVKIPVFYVDHGNISDPETQAHVKFE